MVLNGFRMHDFFEQSNKYRPKIDISDDEPSKKPHDMNEIVKFFGKDLLSMLGQGPIKKTPKKSEEWLRKQKEKNEEPLTPEMEKEIKELFWENYETFSI